MSLPYVNEGELSRLELNWVGSFFLSLFLLCNPCFHNFPVILINCNAEQQFRSYTQTNKLQIWFVKCDVFYTSLRSSGEMINESSFPPTFHFAWALEIGTHHTPIGKMGFFPLSHEHKKTYLFSHERENIEMRVVYLDKVPKWSTTLQYIFGNGNLCFRKFILFGSEIKYDFALGSKEKRKNT